MARLVRDRDGEGHYGSVLKLIPALGDSAPVAYWDGNPDSLLGNGLFIGTAIAGMFSDRDWWCTTVINEIIEVSNDFIRFKTKNSAYTLYR